MRNARALALALGVTSSGCLHNVGPKMLDVAMGSAKRSPSHRGMRVGDRMVLAGDLHCHVLPPDASWHVSRGLPETLALAASEDLDFVVLTPHVPRRFFMLESKRRWVLETQAELRAHLARLQPSAIVIPGFEYTDFEYGHVGAAFADVREVLAAVSVEEARRRPERFFEQWVAQGGVLTINHPVERPLPDAPFRQLRADLSWRAFAGRPVPPEMAWVTEHAQSVETFNASISHLRDQYILTDEERSLREAAALVDREARAQKRRIAPVGGSDSHGSWLRPTTYVLAKERSREAIREAIQEARTCVRGPEACTLEVAAPDSAFHGVGDSLRAGEIVRAKTRGGEATYFVNGAIAARGADGETVTLAVPPNRCALVRAVVERSWSAPVYVNCSFP
jgi:hypothetical protein